MDQKACLEGIADALDLTREDGLRLRDGHKTQTVTWRQLDDALAASPIRRGAFCSAGRFWGQAGESRPQGRHHARHGKALASERGDEAGADMVFWRKPA